MNVKIIKSEKDYEVAMARLSDVMARDLKPGSTDEDELELPALVINDFERQTVPPDILIEDIETDCSLVEREPTIDFSRFPLQGHGISFVIEKHFKRTFLDGAAMLDGDRPIVALTLRHDRIDNFWFALLHEVAHVALHLSPESPVFIDDLDRTNSERAEKDSRLFPYGEERVQQVRTPRAPGPAQMKTPDRELSGVSADDQRRSLLKALASLPA